ncbi:MAG: hypothetical protein RR937_04735 [Ruthenibacterium sp.]
MRLWRDKTAEMLKTLRTLTQKHTRCTVIILAVLICCNLAALTAMCVRQPHFVPAVSAAAQQQQTVDEKISEDMQWISANEAPHFAGYLGEGDVRIEIAAACHYAYRVTYTLAASQKQILQTGLLEPGTYLLKKPLDTTLAAGKYEVIALFTAYDLTTQQAVGEAAQSVTFYVDI